MKICCIASAEEAALAASAGAGALGLVGEMPSGPGVLPDAEIAAIARSVPPPIATFLLTSRQSAAGIAAHHAAVRTTAVQIVDRLTHGTYREIREALPGIKLVQVVHVTGPESLDEALSIAADVDALLLDSGNPSLAVKELGGTGRIHDWRVSRSIREQAAIPVFLAGGLGPSNVAEAIERVGPFGLDVCSGVRTGGRLDVERRHEVFGELGREQERGAGHGVAEAERERVEREAAETDGFGEEAVERAFSVVGVADERVVDVLHVAADLVETACQRVGFDKGGAAHVGREVGSGFGGHEVAGAEPGHGGDAGAVLAAGDRVIDGAFVRGEAAHEGQVGLLDGASLEVALEEGGDLGAAREQEDAARGAVQAVDGRDALAERLAGQIDGGHGVVAPAAVHEKAGGLREDGERVVGVEEEQGGRGAHAKSLPRTGAGGRRLRGWAGGRRRSRRAAGCGLGGPHSGIWTLLPRLAEVHDLGHWSAVESVGSCT